VADFVAQARIAITIALAVLAFRAFPFCLSFSLDPRVSSAARLAWVGGYVLLCWLLSAAGLFDPAAAVAGYAYCAAVGVAVSWLLARRAGGIAGRAAVALVGLSAFLLLPRRATSSAIEAQLIIGWECWLKTYSYSVEVSRGRDGGWREYLFFLLLDPTLVYRNRRLPDALPRLRLKSAARIAEGCALMAVGAGTTLSSMAATLVEGWSFPRPVHIAAAVMFLSIYATHAGLASMRIGLMGVGGYSVPECYVRPMWATSPLDFWNRWNTYMREWARAYVYLPCIGRLRANRLLRSRVRLVTCAAVVTTFAVVGLLHDVYRDVTSHARRLDGTLFFLAMGCICVSWEIVARLARRLSRFGIPRSLMRATAHACALTLMFLSAVVWARAFLTG
jgi:hypothetical protein